MKKLHNPKFLHIWLFFAWGLVFFPSCKTVQKITSKNRDEVSASFLREQLIQKQVKAEWLSAKFRVGFEGLGQKASATSTIKLRKDSLLWMNIKKLGFEVARIQLTPDSVYFIDRVNNQYLVKDLKFLEKQYNLPADFNTLQALLLGNPIFFVKQGMNVENTAEAHHLFAEEASKANHFWLTPLDYHLSKMSYTDKAKRRGFSLVLQKYAETADSQKFSYLRNIDLNSRETGQVSIEIDFSKVILNEPVIFRFEIPKRYSRVD